ncbi:MAG TPA: hypothetical protein VMR34_03895 [Candidatus Saccharimonadales bacterium]|nr:hypothetical protein [Candidatus Saccharimonadales bacterium]
MSNIQYTIRNVPPDLDRVLRLRSKKSKQSFNTTVVKALRQAATPGAGKSNSSDLDWFYGSGGFEQAELDSFNQQRVVDVKAWKSK